MSLQKRIAALEAATAGATVAGWLDRWFAAHDEIAATMSAGDYAAAHADLVAWLEAGCPLDRGGLSFVGARIVSLADRAANGHPAALTMPPALAAAWRALDARLKDAPPAERFNGSFDCQTCASCGAEHPWLGRRERDARTGRREIVNPEELIKTCLVCGGSVGQFAPPAPAQAAGVAAH